MLRKTALLTAFLATAMTFAEARAVGGDPPPDCQIVKRQSSVVLRSPHFMFTVETGDGLRARTWTHERTGHAVDLGAGPELEVDLGALGGVLKTPQWKVADLQTSEGAEGTVIFRLESEDPRLAATVTYRWTAAEPVLRKFVELANESEGPIELLDVRLGDFRTTARLEEREQGFPVYLDGEFFMSLAHPAGWATARDGRVRLLHHPGTTLVAGARFTCMETVYGVGEAAGGARAAFVEHVRSRMRRVVRGHDRPYAIFDNFGSWPEGKDHEFFTQNTEAHLLHSLDRLGASQRATGCRFDVCNLHFWVDHAGDLKRLDPDRFPQGITPIKQRLDELGIAPGLWIDSAMAAWSIGRNPDVAASFTEDRGWFCRASEPIRSLYLEAFLHHIRENGVRLVKFDNLRTVCNNPQHDHLPGVYSTEAITNSVIAFLNALDAACPDVFLILYWGHRSPWWLLHGDTLFDSGIGIEAASPAVQPAPFARDSVTQKLDQAQEHARDIPPLGKDSLGVWLSDWGWNSSIGKERWQEGVVMDMCRGSMLIQLWADRDWLSPSEWEQLADFIALIRQRPECFSRPRWILGSPSKDEPYGYSCSDGERAFLAIHNATWQDNVLPLTLGSPFGLPDRGRWDLYRWYPNPARLTGDSDTFGEQASIALRPFEVVLLEVVPAGDAPSLGKELETQPIPVAFSEASRTLDVEVGQAAPRPRQEGKERWTVLRPHHALSTGGATLTVQSDGSILAGGKNASPDTYTLVAETDLERITGVRIEVLPDSSLPSGGPGRCFNGNLALAELALDAAPRGGEPAAKRVIFARALADFSQTSHGGWPVASAIDGDPRTAWSIFPQVSSPHTAVFEAEESIGFPGGTVLTFSLLQGYVNASPDHTIGRLRLAVTTDPPPFDQPEGIGPRIFTLKVTAPPTMNGGTLVVTTQLTSEREPIAQHNIGTQFSAAARINDQPVECQPVLGNETYPSSWQAWRIPVAEGSASQLLELSVATDSSPDLSFRAFFLPR
ncbi:MAG: alpha-amylase family protein [Pirellulaceae bacterium]